jgi:hypothetical protein
MSSSSHLQRRLYPSPTGLGLKREREKNPASQAAIFCLFTPFAAAAALEKSSLLLA